jgi:type IV pilus assembly protein PilM
MIKNIFIPEIIKSYYIISQRIIAFDFNKNTIYATIITAQGKKRIIEKCIEEPIVIDPHLDYSDRVAQTIKKIISTGGKIDKIYSAFPSALAVIKELEIPFKGIQKIKMLLPFEIEPLLPFPLSQAVIDCIVAATHENKTTVLVAAIKKQYIDEHVDLFLKADVTPQKVTLDLFELYGLYLSIPSYAQLKGTIGLLDIGVHTTRILIIKEGRLIGLRALPKGIASLIKAPDTLDNVIRFGFKNIAEIETLESFFNEIQFSLDAALIKKDIEQKYDKLLVAGFAAQIPEVETIMTEFLSIPTEIFNLRKIIHNNTVVVAPHTVVPSSCAVSLATALSFPLTESFNLETIQGTSESDKKLLLQQLLTAFIISIFLIATVATYSFMTLRNLNKEAVESEQQALNQLKKEFTLPRGKESATLFQALKAAQLDLSKKETVWFSLLPSNSIIKILAELSGRLDREGLGLVLKKLTIRTDQRNQDVMIEGSVKDYDALNHFEEELRQSRLFKTVPKLQDLKFNMTLILEKSDHQL